jgi:NAD kinase
MRGHAAPLLLLALVAWSASSSAGAGASAGDGDGRESCEAGKTNVMVVSKWKDAEATDAAVAVCRYLQGLGAQALVEPSTDMLASPDFASVGARVFRSAGSAGSADSSEGPSPAIDLLVIVGGDGTLLHANTLFPPSQLPPSIIFAAGSLGFLSNFALAEFKPRLLQLLLPAAAQADAMTLISTLRLHVERTAAPAVGAPPAGATADPAPPRAAINEVAVHRGTGRGLLLIDVFLDGAKLTTVQVRLALAACARLAARCRCPWPCHLRPPALCARRRRWADVDRTDRSDRPLVPPLQQPDCTASAVRLAFAPRAPGPS